ncbi:MAG: Tad domain-containing protein, partial [Bdellovibrionales bacterium]|nr:Tad domain-containing protein [Bdellovibrionales bacterium]
MKLLKSNKSLLTGNKGQVALFVALIFQVLFLFFAMIVNVGLVVHHKINLQNSVDMAAYYGAMKQAELLNSIAHINYQMRQSWKLLAWRYRVIGSAGDEQFHPYVHLPTGLIRQGMDQEFSNDPKTNSGQGNFMNPPFCVTYNPFNEGIVPNGETTCKHSLDPNVAARAIHLFKPPAIHANFISFAKATKQITINMQKAAQNRCIIVGPFNYITIGRFMLAYQLDQYTRRVTISRISRNMSQSINDFWDIDGGSVKDGSEETFKRNLSEANKESSGLTFKLYNSLADKGCGNIPSDNEAPPPWLSEIRVFPMVYYLDLKNCDFTIGSTKQPTLDYVPKSFDLKNISNVDSADNEISMPYSYFNGKLNNNPGLKEKIKYIAQSMSLYNDRYRFVVGFEKNPWCEAYVGIKASSNPKIPFAPSDLTLTATSFAKPFGGRIGPWYYKNWSKGTPESTGGPTDRIDEQLPLRVKDIATLQSDEKFYANPLRIANYSKYIGDPYGLRSWRSLAYMTKALYNLNSKSPYRNVSPITATDNKILGTRSQAAPRIEDWSTIDAGVDENKEKDILAWNNEDDKESGMRELEIAALAPDQFDLAYYSIEPNFYANYYKKLRDGLIKKIGLDEQFLRPDLGARVGDPKLEKFSVKDQ